MKVQPLFVADETSCTKRIAAAALTLRLAGGMSILACSCAAHAGLYTEPYASAAIEYDSNIFRLTNKQQPVASGGQPLDQLSDTLSRYVAGMNASYTFGQQRLYVSGEGRRTNYQHFTELDNNSYLWFGGLEYKLYQFVDGVVEHRQERRLASFENRNTTVPEKVMEYDDRATLNFTVTPEWRLENGVTYRNEQSPLVDQPNFGYRETGYRSAVKYLGFGKLTGGVEAHFLRGSYFGEVDQTGDSKYFERGVGLALEDKISGLSTLSGNADYTRRTNEGAGASKFSGLTGSFAYDRKITGKTDADIHVFRRTSSYDVAVSTIIETGAGLGFNWTPTDKIKATARYDYSSQRYRSQNAGTTTDLTERKDHFNTASLNASYDVLKWLNAQTYANYSFRGTNAQNAEYRDLILGLQLTVTFKHGEGA